jgi:predicted PurR-regulated permease PerM
MPDRNDPAAVAAVATVVIAVLMGCAAFTWLGPVLRPFLVAVFLFYATQSAAKALVRVGLRPLTAYAACLLLAVAAVALVGQLVYLESREFLAKWPQHERRIERALADVRLPAWLGSGLPAVGTATDRAGDEPAVTPGDVPPQTAMGPAATLRDFFQNASRTLLDYVFLHSLDIVEPLVLVVVYFLFLFAGSRKLSARTLRAFPGEQGRRILQIEDGITDSMEGFMAVKTLVGAGMAVVAAGIMAVSGVDHWLLWSVAFLLANYVTYIGSAAACVPPIIMAFLGLHPLMATTVAGLLVLNRFVWIDFVEVHMAGRHLSLDPVVVFLWLAYWGWVWGVVGLLLAYPMLAAVRVGLLHFEGTRGLGILLGDE